jgi:hypothetical protein
VPGAPARQLDWFQSITTVQYGGEKRWEEYRKKVGPQCDRESEDETADILGFQETDRYPTAVFVPSEVRGLSFPRVASVLSVEDNIRLETDLLLRRSS